MDLSSVASLTIPTREKNAYDIKYQQEDYDTCGISALSSALHILIHPDFAKAIILQKQKYLDVHKKEKHNTKNNEMTMLIVACNDHGQKYRIKLKRSKKEVYSLEKMKNGQEYYLIVVCLLKDSHERNDHIIVISHG